MNARANFFPAGRLLLPLVLLFSGQARALESWQTLADRLVRANLVYCYGSTDPAVGGLDCSGFTMLVFRETFGVVLPNESGKQYDYLRQYGRVWDAGTGNWKKDDLQPGDLIFWSGTRPSKRASPITHVMIYCGNNIMVGAQSAGRQLNGKPGGVGYYAFHPVPPKGMPGKDDPQIRTRPTLYAYGRLGASPLPSKGGNG